MRSEIRPKELHSPARVLVCLLVLWVGLGAKLVLAAPEPVGKVESLQGTVSVEREGASGPAAAADPVFLYDKWQTQDESGVELGFADQSRIQMGPKAFLEITQYVYQPEEKSRDSLISLMAGKARVVVQDLQDYKQQRFRVQTQTAVVGTRGTEFIVWVVSPEVTRVLGIDREIDFCNRGDLVNCVVVAPTMMSEVRTTQPPTPPVVAPPEVVKEMTRGVETPAAQPAPPAPPPPPPPNVPQVVTDTYDPTASSLTVK